MGESNRARTLLAGTVLAAGMAFPRAALGLAFNTELVLNGTGEAGAGSPTGDDVLAVPGWTSSGNFTVANYAAVSVTGALPSFSDPGPAARGINLFVGGPANAFSSASQIIDLSSAASLIDAGDVSYQLGAFLGGYGPQEDNAVLRARFRNAANSVVLTRLLGPVSAANRTSLTGLWFRSDTGVIPTGIRNVELSLQMTRTDGAYNDGYADNVSLVLTVPEPATGLSALVAATLLLGGRHGRQRRIA